MQFSKPLIPGTLIKRYKRFLADVRLDATGETICAHCPNTGSMKTCAEPGSKVYLSHNPDPKRKLKYTWELTETSDGFIGINTLIVNRIVEEAIRENRIPELSGYTEVKREVKFGQNSRMDFMLTRPGTSCFVEVKNTTLLDGHKVLFPDAVSTRALKHVHELALARQNKQAHKSVLLFVVNRPEGTHFSPAWDIDKEYANALKKNAKWIDILAYRTINTPTELKLASRVEIDL